MLNELKTFFNNIKNFRYLLNEGVSSDVIKHAIENHEYLFIYYNAPEDGSISKGYRTIRPYVLGTTTAGNLAVRAYQDKGKTDSLRTDSPRKRMDHEYHIDIDGATKAGWRLFLINGITSAYPTGKLFNDKDGNVMIPPLYNQNDKRLTGIIASISSTPDQEIKTAVSGGTVTVKPKTSKWEQFYNANAGSREITSNDILKLNDIAKKVMKKSINNFFVAINDRKEFSLQDLKIKSKFPSNAIVGDLGVLYGKYILSDKTTKPEEINFVKQAEDKAKKIAADSKNRNNLKK